MWACLHRLLINQHSGRKRYQTRSLSVMEFTDCHLILRCNYTIPTLIKPGLSSCCLVIDTPLKVNKTCNIDTQYTPLLFAPSGRQSWSTKIPFVSDQHRLSPLCLQTEMHAIHECVGEIWSAFCSGSVYTCKKKSVSDVYWQPSTWKLQCVCRL